MFRRIRRAAFQPGIITPDQMQMLRNANSLVATGKTGQAAPLFAQLATQMQTSHPRRSANLHAQAAHAYADSQNEQEALSHARIALSLFRQYQMVNRIPVFYTNITRKITNKGMTAAFDALVSEFGSGITVTAAPAKPPVQPRGQLPTNCPKCGAPIHKNDANWVDDQTIECDFCGSLVNSV